MLGKACSGSGIGIGLKLRAGSFACSVVVIGVGRGRTGCVSENRHCFQKKNDGLGEIKKENEDKNNGKSNVWREYRVRRKRRMVKGRGRRIVRGVCRLAGRMGGTSIIREGVGCGQVGVEGVMNGKEGLGMIDWRIGGWAIRYEEG